MKVPHSNSFWLCFAVPVKKKKNTFSFENTTTGLGVAFLLHVPSLQNIGIFTGQHYSTRSVFWQRADLVVSLQLLYRRSRIQSATWPTFQQSTHHIQPASQPAKQPDWPCPALLCPAQNWLSAGVIRVSALLACPCAKPVCKHQAETCKFIDLHLY